MRATEIIERKRDGQAITRELLKDFIEGYVSGKVPDYQMAAFLMAVFFKGMSTEETADLTSVMLRSGEVLPREHRDDFWVDKHSTGGMGDKTSLLLVPLVVSAARRLFGPGHLRVPMISGRGLGFSGGTLDKLESVPGFSPALSREQAMRLLKDADCFMMGQTPDIAPADRLIYSLRDVTATVESLPLIVSSIMSKKLAESLDGLVLDVKAGSGAFMKDKDRALELARALQNVAETSGVRTVALVTRMDEPLGRAVGHSLEVEECASFLKGEPIEDGLKEVTLTLAGWMLALGSRGKITFEKAKRECENEIATRGAWKIFVEMIRRQGGDWSKFGNRKSREGLHAIEWPANSDGWISRMDAGRLGTLVHQLGGGRVKKEDTIDAEVGLVAHRKVGDRVGKGEAIVTVYTRPVHERNWVEQSLREAVQIADSVVTKLPWIVEVLS